MKRFIVGFTIICSCTTFSFSGPFNYSNAMTADSQTVTISTTPASPTQILTRSPFVERTWIVNQSTFSIYISSYSTTISTTSAFAIPKMGATTADPVIFSPDGVNEPYSGAMYAVSETTQSPPKISVFRSK